MLWNGHNYKHFSPITGRSKTIIYARLNSLFGYICGVSFWQNKYNADRVDSENVWVSNRIPVLRRLMPRLDILHRHYSPFTRCWGVGDSSIGNCHQCKFDNRWPACDTDPTRKILLFTLGSNPWPDAHRDVSPFRPFGHGWRGRTCAQSNTRFREILTKSSRFKVGWTIIIYLFDNQSGIRLRQIVYSLKIGLPLCQSLR